MSTSELSESQTQPESDFSQVEGGTPWMFGSTPGFVSLNPTPQNNIYVGLFAFFFAPIALFVLEYSAVSVLQVASLGQPLSSSTGQIGLFGAAVMLVLLGSTSVFSSIGLVVTAAWASLFSLAHWFFAVIYSSKNISSSLLLDQINASAITKFLLSGSSAQWCHLPTIVAVICVCAAFASARVRQLRRFEVMSAAKLPLKQRQQIAVMVTSGDALWWSTPGQKMPATRYRAHVSTFLCALGLSFIACATCYYLAPSNLSSTVYSSSLMELYSVDFLNLIVFIASLAGLMLLTVRSTVGTTFVSWGIFALVGLIGIPLWASLSGNVATTSSAVNTSIAFASPILGMFGILIGAFSIGVHLVRTGPLFFPEITTLIETSKNKDSKKESTTENPTNDGQDSARFGMRESTPRKPNRCRTRKQSRPMGEHERWRQRKPG